MSGGVRAAWSGHGAGPLTRSSTGTPLEPHKLAHLPQEFAGWASMLLLARSMDIINLCNRPRIISVVFLERRWAT